MCQCSVTARDGKPNEWHYTHLASRAVGGVGLIEIEMTSIEPDGRITDLDLGLWSDEQVTPFARLVDACHRYGAKVAVQIGHAGQKAEDALQPVAPSAVGFDGPNYKTPRPLATDEVKRLVDAFAASARRALAAGVDTVELHGAHGYLLHQFHSQMTNRRADRYGQDLTLFGTEVVQAVKTELPSRCPLIMRVSAVEYVDGGYGIGYSEAFCKAYQRAGIDMFHVSSGGEGTPGRRRPGNFPGYQVPFARAIREALGVPVIAVGMLEDYQLADSVIGNEDADLVAIGRGLLRDPYWPLHAALALGCTPEVPKQYHRAFHPSGSQW
jgi:2,4-dienoyl-CoA reductase-like NADH-dependent reductase (Old Yellow Enzyme family)